MFPDITAVVLAGGRGLRMGGLDKGLVEVAGRPLIGYTLAALAPQVGAIVINANRNAERYRAWGYPVIADASGDFDGPLAGMCAALGAITTPLLLTVPCDCPRLAPDLAARLHAALLRDDAEIAVAHDGTRTQPVFALLRRELHADLAEQLAAGERKIDRWFRFHRLAPVDFSDRPEHFVNLNSPEEKAAFEAEIGGVCGDSNHLIVDR